MDVTVAHHIKGFRPALTVMKELGFSVSDCLKETGISAELLEKPEQGITLQQELAFYRRLLMLSKDPLIGLFLGKAYRLETYGVLGYAILSAETLGQALEISSEFGSLSFTHFSIGYSKENRSASVHMSTLKPFDPMLLPLFADRDFSAILSGTEAALGQRFPIQKVHLMHEGEQFRARYEAFFQCPVSFNHERMEMFFDAAFLATPMPLRDTETLEYCRRQCQHLLTSQTQQSSFVDEVRQILLAKPDNFPSVKETAELIGVSERTLRRRLSDRGHQFQTLLNEIRYQLARDYLNSELSLDNIATKLGYSETANFSHAFKRWSGQSPSQFRTRRSSNSR